MTREEAKDFQVAGTLNLGFFLVSALVLWPLGEVGFAWQLFKGYFIYWLVLLVGVFLSLLLQRFLRIESDPPSNAFILMNLILSLVTQVGWSAFAALSARTFAAGEAWWLQAVLYLLGFLTSYLALLVQQAFYRGSIYRFATGVAAIVAYLVFAFWPAAARALYGWFFGLFE